VHGHLPRTDRRMGVEVGGDRKDLRRGRDEEGVDSLHEEEF
jgi:hypothetical protein